jgi:nucleoside-diphosphate-sugar epimerase
MGKDCPLFKFRFINSSISNYTLTTVLITGGKGVLGGHLVDELSKAGYKVIATSLEREQPKTIRPILFSTLQIEHHFTTYQKMST